MLQCSCDIAYGFGDQWTMVKTNQLEHTVGFDEWRIHIPWVNVTYLPPSYHYVTATQQILDIESCYRPSVSHKSRMAAFITTELLCNCWDDSSFGTAPLCSIRFRLGLVNVHVHVSVKMQENRTKCSSENNQ